MDYVFLSILALSFAAGYLGSLWTGSFAKTISLCLLAYSAGVLQGLSATGSI